MLGTDVFFTPLVVQGPSGERKLYGPLHGLLAYYNNDVTCDTDATITHYGTSHTFKCLGTWWRYHVYPTSGNQMSTAGVLAVRWE